MGNECHWEKYRNLHRETPKGRIVSNLTKWEVGQDLIECADLLSEKDGEIRNSGFIEESNSIREAKKLIADVFNKLGSHGFGL